MHGNTFDQNLSGKNMKFALVVSRFNHEITSKLREGCVKGLLERNVADTDIEIFNVPGSFEIPVVAKLLAKRNRYQAIIALGAVVRGATPHFDYVCNEVADGVARTSYDMEIPVIFGIITTNDMKQAEDRVRNDQTNKGYEAALAAIEMALLVKHLKNV